MISERYVIERLLGKGAMAMVYRVRHIHLNTLHAMKILMSPSSAVQQRLMQEGRVQASLRHANVVSVTDIAMFDGAAALVMEYIEGPPLNELLKTRTMNLIQAVALGEGILQGVAAAHDHGLIHRDLKPANVMLAVEGGAILPKVTDFGLAKLSDADRTGDMTATKTGIAMGTPAYMAPEQFRDAKSVDQRADVFSVGAILYELVCGARAFKGNSFLDVYHHVAEGNYAPIDSHNPDIPMEMQAAIKRALSVNPAERHEDCHDLLTQWKSATKVILSQMKEDGLRAVEPWDQDLMNTVNVLSSSEDITDEAQALENENSPPSTSLDTWTDVDTNLEAHSSIGSTANPTVPEKSARRIGFVVATLLLIIGLISFVLFMFQPANTASEIADIEVDYTEPKVINEIPEVSAPTPSTTGIDVNGSPTKTVVVSEPQNKSPKARNKSVRTIQPKPQRNATSSTPEPESTLKPVAEAHPLVAIEEKDTPETTQPNVTVVGDAKRVWLVSAQGTFGPGTVPVGTYKIKVLFDGKEPLEVGEVSVNEGSEHVIKCQSLFSKCKVN